MAHDPFKAIVAPRPIGWIGTKGRDGSLNLSPYSFFNIVSDQPKLVMFSSSGRKHSLKNAEETGHFTASLASRHLADQMNASSAPVPYGVNEFELAGLTARMGELVDAPFVAEAYTALECQVTDIMQPSGLNGRASESFLVFGEAFLRWAETARAGDRARAANALARAFLHAQMGTQEQRASVLAMTYLLDDPSPKVRLALAEALASSPEAPRAIIVALAQDQPEIACMVIMNSPVLREDDLVELVGRGHSFTRALVAARPRLGRGACAAIAEIGSENEILLLLENRSATVSRVSLRRLAERFGHSPQVRDELLDRDDLPADARHILVRHVATALAQSGLVRQTVGDGRMERLSRETSEAAAVAIADTVSPADIPRLVDHLRSNGLLTPSLLIHALCSGRTDFFAQSICALVDLDERRVRSILATGRAHSVRALFEAAGISRSIVGVFVEAVFQWRGAAARDGAESCYAALLARFADLGEKDDPVKELLAMVEQLHNEETRREARSHAGHLSLAA
eukprot:g19936.t1